MARSNSSQWFNLLSASFKSRRKAARRGGVSSGKVSGRALRVEPLEDRRLLTTVSFLTYQKFSTADGPMFVAMGDLNGDGKSDVVTANRYSNDVSVLLNTTETGSATASFAVKTQFATGTSPRCVALGDINGDGKLDIATADYNSTGYVSVLLNTTEIGATTPTFAAKRDFSTGTSSQSVALADINGDGKLDLIVANTGSNNVSVLLNTTATGATTASFAARQNFATGGSPVSVAVGDFNADGKVDVVTSSSGSQTASVLLNTTESGATTPSFASKQDFGLGAYGYCVVVADLNADGRPDMATANPWSNDMSVLLNTTSAGATTFSFTTAQRFSTQDSLSSAPYCGFVGDIDGDGKLDLVAVGQASKRVSVLVNTMETGATTPSFATTKNFSLLESAQPRAVTVGDVNGDGKLDVVSADSGANTMSVLLNTTTSTTAPIMTAPTATSITATGATLGGTVSSDGGAALTKRGVLYALTSENPNPTLGGTGVIEVDDASATTGTFTESISGLAVGTSYSYVAFATNSVGTRYTSPVSTFTTLAPTPTLSSPTATSITTTGAVLGGTIDSDGGLAITKRGVLYALTSVNSNPTLGGTGVIEVDDAGATTGTFTESISGLAVGASYSYVAFATNSAGTSYTSPVSTFTTLQAPTTLVSLDGSGNLVITDISTGGTNDSLTITCDTVNGLYLISDPNNLLTTTIAGATGDGTHVLSIPFTAVTGTLIQVNTGAGDDTVTINGLVTGGKSLAINGGTGTDAVVFGTNATDLGTGSLSVTATTLTLNAAVTAAGATLDATAGVAINAALTTGAGGLNANADTDSNGTGTFTISAGGAIAAGSGNVSITAADVSIGGAVAGTGSLTLAPSTAASTIGIGGGSGTFNLSDGEIALLADGFSSITIGNLAAGTGAVDVQSETFTDPLTIVGGSIAVKGLDAGTNAVALTARTGSITVGTGSGIDVTGGSVTLNAKGGTIGSSGSSLVISATSLVTDTSTGGGNQYLSASGSLTWNTSTAGTGTITLGSGTFNTAGTITAGTLSVASAATLAGTGTIAGNVSGAGTVSPAATDIGILTIQGNFTPTGTVAIQINSPHTTAGTDYDQLVVSGTIDLSGATLGLGGDGTAASSNFNIKILNNTGAGPVTAFGGLAEEAAVSNGSFAAKISYVKGDGNDVVLVNRQVTPTVTVTDAGGVYNGSAYAVTDASVTVSGTVIASFGDLTLSYTYYSGGDALAGAPTDVGSYTVVAHYTSDSSDYTDADSEAVAFTITAKTLTVSGITAGNKTYDGNTTASLSTGGAALVGVVGSDAVNLVKTSAVGVFASADVGTGITVTVSGLTLSGAKAGNYTLTQPTTTANITAKTLTVSGITASNKTYDGNTTASLNTGSAALVGVVGSDAVNLIKTAAVGTFASADVGTGITVNVSGLTLSGAKSGNYTLTQPITTANITAKTLTVSGITASNKTYDGNTTASLNTGSAALVGTVGSDAVNLVTTSAVSTFASADVGTGITVNVSGLTLSGAKAGNYTLTQPTTTANITAKTLTVSGITASNKTYDGNTTASLNTGSAALVGVVGSDAVNLVTTSAVGTFASADVGTGITVNVSGLTLSGTKAGNYTLTQPTTTANITAKTLTVSGITASNKTYDGNTTASLNTGGAALVGAVGSDAVNLVTTSAVGAFASADAGTGITVNVSGLTLSGAKSGNYTLTQPTTTANITAKTLTVSGITASNKTYDGNTTASLNTGGAALVGTVGTDAVNLVTTSAVGTFASADAGTSITVNVSGLTLSGTKAGNYTLTQPTTTANITAKTLTVSGITASNKTYDGNTTASLNTGSAALVGVVGSDAVNLVTTSAVGAFASADAGTGITVNVSGLTLSGTKSGNYTLTQPTTTANITAKTLTVSGITASNKTYDGNTTASLNTGSAALVGVVGSDAVNLVKTSAVGAFASADVGTGITVNVSGLTLSGAKAGNYTLTQPTTTANITAKMLTVSGITASNKSYDGNTTASLNTGSAALVGTVGSDAVNLVTTSAVGAFASADVGTGITVNVSGLTLSGAKSGNYTLTQPTTTANITAKTLTVSGITASNKTYDGNTTATLNTGSAALVGVVGSDAVNLVKTSAVGAFASADVGTGITVNVSGLTLSGAKSGNYTLTQPTTTANITKRSLTVTATGVNKTYDGTTTATATLSDNRVGGDSLTVSYTTATFSNKNVGTNLTVNVNGISISGTKAGNYTLANTTAIASANITKAILTIKADNKTKTYGAANPALTVSFSGFVNGETSKVLTTQPTAATTATAKSSVGNYSITVNGAAAANYSFSYGAGTLTINPAVLTVKANDQAKYVGDALPVFTVTYSGFVNGETSAVLKTLATASTKATASSPAGTYAITAGGAAAMNYTFSYVAGNLYVVQHPGAGAAALLPDPLNPTAKMLEITGTSLNDVIQVTPDAKAGQVKVTFNTKVLGTYSPTSRIVIHGKAGNDYLGVSNSITLAAWEYGEEGNDQLWGGGGLNMLMGGVGNDTLWGGNGKGLLIGGAGSDSLMSATGDNALIGGITAYDANDAALMTVLNTWSTTPVASRVSKLASGSYPLTAQTVFDDKAVDSLFGGSGNDLFFQSLTDKLVKGKKTLGIISVSKTK